MTTSAKTGARYTGHNGATVLAEVRTISGLPSRHHLCNTISKFTFLDFDRPHRILGKPGDFEDEYIKNQIAVRRVMPPNLFWFVFCASKK
jgi:hypothetical protein